ncbi:hypothetical protein KP509_28G019500 [Ceratopteris richardii]|uniref:HP domain-containing protein n=4 Tax=Ceratopteris richardii TaxID=49495 RepID=A0A8T2RBZ0_CERRI|nr:hypothetical protein KP509_28G019500 [Ceratopteris richardii]KAH7293294.1 hypothetical protein KP509_28G019500 [Ceratopteris richardii]
MAVSMKDIDGAFQNVGNKQGVDIWLINKSHPVIITNADHRKMSSSNCYVILQSVPLRSGVLRHEIFYWLGRHATQDDITATAIKAIELDAALGGRAVISREAENYETDRFLSYFKPCFMPLNDMHSYNDQGNGRYQVRLFKCNGRHVAHVKEVSFTRASLSHEDIFILDTEFKIFQFNGANTDIYQRAKAMDVVKYVKDNFHKKDCSVAVIEDGKFVADADSGEFWGFFGGYAPLGRRSDGEGHSENNYNKASLLCVFEGQTKKIEGSVLTRDLLSSNKCYILDCGTEYFAWVGRDSSLEERRTMITILEGLIALHDNSVGIRLTCAIEGFEPREFKLKFQSWPANTAVPISENGRGKVAVLLKHKGFNVKGMLKAAPIKQDISSLNRSGKIQVWHVNNSDKFTEPASNHGKFFSSSCYIVLHTFPGDRKDDYIIYSWIGHGSLSDTRTLTASSVAELASSLKGAVEVLVFESKEPSHFTALFPKMLVIKDENIGVGERLFQVQQTGPRTWQAVEVEKDAKSLNSSGCAFLLLETRLILWFGKFSTVEEQEAAENLAYFLQPDAESTMSLKEGAESELFWEILGGRKVHPSHREPKENAKDPQLFSCRIMKGQLQLIELFNFTQNDLLSDEVLVLDVHTDVYVWIGQSVSSKLKLMSFEIGQKFAEQAARYDGRSLENPLYKIEEGHEPVFFKSFFQWDDSKAMKHLDVFQKKVAAVKGQQADTARRPMRRHSISGFESPTEILSTIDRGRASRNTVAKPQSSPEKSRAPKPKYGNGRSPGSKSSAVSALSSMFEFQGSRDANTTPKLSSVRTRHESVSATPSPSLGSSPRTPRPVASPRSPAIAALASMFEPYSDKKLDFAWPGSRPKSEEKVSRDFDVHIPRTTKEAKLVETLELKNGEESSPKQPIEALKDVKNGDVKYYPYERLKVSSSNPISGIDSSKREAYLSNQDFQDTFRMDRETFYKLPKWKQDKYKILMDLF